MIYVFDSKRSNFSDNIGNADNTDLIYFKKICLSFLSTDFPVSTDGRLPSVNLAWDNLGCHSFYFNG